MSRPRRRAPKRTMSWASGVSEILSTASAASTVREVALFVPTEDHEGATVTRIIGSVVMGLTTAAVGNDIHRISWGIYIAGSGSDGDMKMDPSNVLDHESNHWLHLRWLYENTAVSNLATPGGNYPDYAVDIRVQRKVAEGDGIKLVFNAPFAYESAASLRVLLKHT